MRLRTGHNPSDWSENVPAAARLSGHGGSSIHGELVRGGESDADRARRQSREHMRRVRSVDLNDYQREDRWDGKQRCGAMMKQAGMPCARMAGHRREHKSAEAMEYVRTRRRKDAA